MTILGRDPQGNLVEITITNQLTGIYTIGATGSGKTTLLENMIIENIHAGLGLAVLDPHGDLINNIIRRCPENRLDDIILFNPLDVDYPMGLNIFTCDKDDILSVEYAVELIIGVYEKVFNMSVAETPRLSQYVRQVARALVGTGYTMSEIPLLLQEKSFRDKLSLQLDISPNKLFWKTYDSLRLSEQLDRSESTLDRIDSLLSNRIIRNIVGQSKTTINFRNIMDSGKILLCSFSAQFESLSSLLGSIVISQLLAAILSRANTSKRKWFGIYADEFQRFMIESFVVLWTEARKYKISLVAANQVLAQLSEKMKAAAMQAGSLVCFHVTSEDADELASEFNLEPKEATKPPPTIPRNCNEYLSRHPNAEVRAFYGDFLLKLERNSHTRQREEKFWDIGMQEEYFVADEVYDDFGEGKVSYNPNDLMEIYTLIEKLFYEVMTREKIEPYMNWEFEDEMEEIIINCGAIRGYSEYKYRLSSHLIDNVFVPPPKRIARGGEKKILEWWEKMKAEQLRYYNFQNLLDKIMKILREEKVNATSTEYAEPTSQQSFADKKNQVANELVHMPKFHARVKLPTGEYLISTIQPNDADQMRESGIIRDGGEVKKTMTFSQKKRRIIENTRENYCKPRAEVEDEIRRRQDVGKPPPPITRQHQV